jgi:exonuclease III
VRLITWNVAGRVRRQAEQAAVIARCGADVVALQEVTARTLPLWRAAFAALGFAACESPLDGASAAAGRRLLGVLTAARRPEPIRGPPRRAVGYVRGEGRLA